MGIELVNEVAKLKASAGAGGGGSGSQFGGTSVTRVAKSSFYVSNISNSYQAHAGSPAYQRGFNHGGGQFSVAAIPFVTSGISQTQFYVQPFTVNQTTGTITAGSGSAVWNNTSSSLQSTMNWGSAGPVAFNWGAHGAPGYGSSTGIATAFTVSGNSVTGGYYTDGASWAGNGNQDAAVSFSGGVYYWAPSNNQSGTVKNLVFSYSQGSTGLSRTRNNSLSSDTSTNYVASVVPQFGNLAALQGSIHLYRQSNRRLSIAVLDATFGISTTVLLSSLGIPAGSGVPSELIGIELSNGRQLFYSKSFGIILRDGSTLSNVSNTADFIPNTEPRSRHFTPVAADTWICMSEGSPREVVKFSINPTTYRVTILGSFILSGLTGNETVSSDGVNNGGLHVTGNNNQFVVAISQNNTGPFATVMVGSHNL